MIPPATEIAASIYGAWRLARRDPAGLDYFNRTLEGFWRSFFVAVLVAPGYALLIGLDWASHAPAASFGRAVLVTTIAYVITWVAFPVIMYHIAQAIDRQHRYISFIVAANWSWVIQMVLVLPVALLDSSGVLPTALASLLPFLVTALLLTYVWYIAVTALQVTGWVATGLVALDFFLGIVIDIVTRGMLD
ncbi:MAG: hypothetical protein AAF495_22295 [Pseudomonadota bacterium]